MAEESGGHLPAFSFTASRGFSDWLAGVGGTIAFTTYQANRIFLIGLKPDGRLSIFERHFPRAMGLGVAPDGRTLHLATEFQIYRFDNLLPVGDRQGVHDAVFAPRQAWITGDLDVHDVGIGADGRPIFAATRFNCLATLSDGFSFRPLWRPPFISSLVPEDRCHLNGLAMENGVPRYVTCVSRSDAIDGWRDRRGGGGVVLDVASGAVVADGLSMPHSPRLHQGQLWLLNSGTGEFGWIDLSSGGFNPIAFCPGYARGLALVGGHAVIGLSQAREDRAFQGLPLEQALAQRDVDARCGLLVVDLNTGSVVEMVRIEGFVRELFDVSFLPGARCPSLVGMKGADIRRMLTIDTEEA